VNITCKGGKSNTNHSPRGFGLKLAMQGILHKCMEHWIYWTL
jgi:hypothetical protein